MKNLEVTYSNSAKINTGNYEQLSPLFCIKSMIQSDSETAEFDEFTRLKSLIDPVLDQYIRSRKMDLSKVRIRLKDGEQYPSVTSIINPVPFEVDEEYSIRGTELHRIFNHFALNGVWISPEIALKKLSYDEIKYKEFFDLFKDEIDFKDCKLNIEVFNDDHFYSGEIDIICKVNGLKTLADLKTGKWDWMQLVAYWKALSDNEIKQLAIFDLKKGKLETLELNNGKARKNWEAFLVKLGRFREMYQL